MCGTGCHLWVGVLVFDLQTLFDKVETTILGAKSNPKLSLAALRKDHRCGRLWPGSFLKQEMLIPTLFLHPIHLTSILTKSQLARGDHFQVCCLGIPDINSIQVTCWTVQLWWSRALAFTLCCLRCLGSAGSGTPPKSPQRACKCCLPPRADPHNAQGLLNMSLRASGQGTCFPASKLLLLLLLLWLRTRV